MVVIDAAGEYSMYASDITRTMPVRRPLHAAAAGDLRHRAGCAAGGGGGVRRGQIEDGQRSAAQARSRTRSTRSPSTTSMTHGKDLHGAAARASTCCTAWGTSVGINVHDPWDYTKPLDKGMVFTIEPGIYIPEEKHRRPHRRRRLRRRGRQAGRPDRASFPMKPLRLRRSMRQ